MFLCYKRQAVKNSHEIVVISSSVRIQARYLKSFKNASGNQKSVEGRISFNL